MIKAVIYDLDDLIVNSLPLHFEAWAITLKKLGRSYNELPKDYMNQFVGRKVMDSAVAIVEKLKLNMDVESIFNMRNKIFVELVRENLQLMPGLKYSLDLLKDNKFQIALATSATIEYLSIVLEKFEIKEYFEVIVSGDEVKKGKPDPETYIIACKKLGLNPDECLVLEDATHGIEAAKRSGCKCIGVENPNTPPQDRSKADKILLSLKSLTLNLIRDL